MASELALSKGAPVGMLDRGSEVTDPCSDCPLVTVLVCRKCKGHDKVIDFLAHQTRASIQTVRCQKVCKGPVAGLPVEGRMEWFGRMDKHKSLCAMARLTSQSTPRKIPKPLRKRRSKERSGCRR